VSLSPKVPSLAPEPPLTPLVGMLCVVKARPLSQKASMPALQVRTLSRKARRAALPNASAEMKSAVVVAKSVGRVAQSVAAVAESAAHAPQRGAVGTGSAARGAQSAACVTRSAVLGMVSADRATVTASRSGNSPPVCPANQRTGPGSGGCLRCGSRWRSAGPARRPGRSASARRRGG